MSNIYSQPDAFHTIVHDVFEQVAEIRYQDPDSAITLLETQYQQLLDEQDTVTAILALQVLGEIYSHLANYPKSYDSFWNAMFLADDINNKLLMAQLNRRIGRLYSFYKRKDDALKYFQFALDLDKELIANGELEEQHLVTNYKALCTTYRELDDLTNARLYLDSCLLYYSDMPFEEQAFVLFEKSFVLSAENKTQEALSVMQIIQPWFEENRPAFLVHFYTYLGDLHKDLSDYDESEKYYQKAIEISETYNSHLDFTPLVYERVAELFLHKSDYEKAYENLQQTKKLDALFFDSRSENNRPLLEIKDAFRFEQERREKLMQQQRLAQLEHEEKVLYLQRIILLVVLGALLVVGLVYFKYFKSKYKAEKRLLRRKQELEMQKASELLELKNKELAASALQLVEKDELLGLIKSAVKKNGNSIDVTELKPIVNSISVSNARSWKEFRLRFTAVNEKFYKQLTNRYPMLSQGDQKICALIKLNFSSKDMARLLGISVESVHTTRYRLRKKLGLDRRTNLEDFIATL